MKIKALVTFCLVLAFLYEKHCSLLGVASLAGYNNYLKWELAAAATGARCSFKKDVLRSLVKFTGKHLWQSLFLSKIADAQRY